MSSWKDAANRYDKEQTDERQRLADAQARRERENAAALEEVAKADRLVQEFLRAARSVGNPGTKDEGYYYSRGGDSLISILIFKTKFKVTDRYWAYGEDKSIGFRLPDGRTAKFIQGTTQVTSAPSPDGFVVKVSGLWWYRNSTIHVYDEGSHVSEMGRNAEGLYCSGAVADHIDRLQRYLIVLMRENGIPVPS